MFTPMMFTVTRRAPGASGRSLLDLPDMKFIDIRKQGGTDMKYENTIHGTFCSRPNRFLAEVDVDGTLEIVHVKNTGRCKELLIPGADVVLQKAENENRKTKYDLIAVYKKSLGWVNIDSQAPNKVVLEWLKKQGCHCMVAFVIQMEGVQEVRPNVRTHPEFKDALDQAEKAGVEKLFLSCSVKQDELVIRDYK